MKVMTNYQHSDYFTAGKLYDVTDTKFGDLPGKMVAEVESDVGLTAWVGIGFPCAFLNSEGVWEIIDEPELSADEEQAAFNKFLDKGLPVSPPDVNRHVSGSVGSTDLGAGQGVLMNLVVADAVINSPSSYSGCSSSSSYDSGSSSSSSSSGCD